MWFYDEAGELEEFQAFRGEVLRVEEEHLEIRVGMRDAEAALRADPGNGDLKARLEELRKRLEALEERAPWILSGVPKEILLWEPTHG